MTKAIKIRGLVLGCGIPKICVPLTATSLGELRQEAAEAKGASPDLVEWRADFFQGLFEKAELEKALKELSGILYPIPLLFTIRTKKEGGKVEISAEEYARCNLAAASSGKADLIDVEYFQLPAGDTSLIPSLQALGAKLIASSHDFRKTDSREMLLERFRQMDASGADILKMAVMPGEFGDAAALMLATSEMVKNHTEKPVISMAMGGPGVITRIAGEAFGSSVTFATVGAASAPGQLPIGELRRMLEALHQKNQ